MNSFIMKIKKKTHGYHFTMLAELSSPFLILRSNKQMSKVCTKEKRSYSTLFYTVIRF
jgi:hypothetical protein